MNSQLLAARAMVTAGVLVFVALIGSSLVDGLWLALLPAATLLALALVGGWGRRQRPVPVRVAALALALASAALVGLAVVGLFLQRSVGMEPAWVTGAVTWTGTAFLAGAVVYGGASWVSRTLSRGASLLVASSLPLGLAIDEAVAQLPGIYAFLPVGSYLGLGLFALALVRVGLQVSRLGTSTGGPRRT